MNLLDIRTVIFSYAVSNLLCMVVIAVLWKQNHTRFAGLGYWLADFALQFIALVLVALRGIVPDLLSITGSNVMIIGGTMLLYIGVERFTGKPSTQFHNLFLLLIFTLANAYFTVIQPNLPLRNILFALALLFLCAQCAWLMLRRADPEMHIYTRVVGYVFLAFCFVCIVNIGVNLGIPSGNDLFHINGYETFLVLLFQMLFVTLTFSLFLMVNRRLVAELENDIIVRTNAQAALRLSEEKFSKAFQSSPDAIIITRLRDGKIIEVNDGFCRLTGFSRQEATTSSTIALKLYNNSEDRARVVDELRTNARVRDLEFDIRARSGKILKALYSGEVIELGGEKYALSVIRDISEHKLTESIFQLRLMLWEYSAAHAANEIMQKALDELERLTGSQISFYHGVEVEQDTLTLYAWSTRTRDVFCKAEGDGMHYPIEEAGVWVDCVHQKKPVIHNDYASLPHRKGMPDGHAAVVRELVAPVMRDGKVVAILGVGNKDTDYNENDVWLVSYIADLAWTIIALKRNEEQIRQLNEDLERLAMTDELTGLLNRRSFFASGYAEIKRVHRYEEPLSLLMLDLDGFKALNDRYGHAAGDEVLRCVGKILREVTREVDVVARLGGEEFGILLPNTRVEDAFILAERIRQTIEQMDCSLPNQPFSVTASIGVAMYTREMQSLDTLLRKTDAAMYQAKNCGRNQVVLSE